MEHWRKIAGGDGGEAPPESPDAAYYKRRAAMRALAEQRARRN